MKNRKNRFDVVIYEVEPRTLARHGKEVRKKAKYTIGVCLRNRIGHALISTYNGEMTACLKKTDMMKHFKPIHPAIAPCKRLSILQGILAEHGTSKEFACYVGDRAEGLLVARKMGLYTIALIPRKRRRKRREVEIAHPNIIAHGFDEFLGVFKIPNDQA